MMAADTQSLQNPGHRQLRQPHSGAIGDRTSFLYRVKTSSLIDCSISPMTTLLFVALEPGERRITVQMVIHSDKPLTPVARQSGAQCVRCRPGRPRTRCSPRQAGRRLVRD